MTERDRLRRPACRMPDECGHLVPPGRRASVRTSPTAQRSSNTLDVSVLAPAERLSPDPSAAGCEQEAQPCRSQRIVCDGTRRNRLAQDVTEGRSTRGRALIRLFDGLFNNIHHNNPERQFTQILAVHEGLHGVRPSSAPAPDPGRYVRRSGGMSRQFFGRNELVGRGALRRKWLAGVVG
jgi:hypothetical protein